MVALLDADPRVVGADRRRPRRCGPSTTSRAWSATRGSQIGVIATPAAAAQEVCDRLVAAGVTSVLNFAPCVLAVPDGVMVRKVDLSTELQILAFHEQRHGPPSWPPSRAPGPATSTGGGGRVTHPRRAER